LPFLFLSEKRVKRLENVEKEAVEIYSSAENGDFCLTIVGCQNLHKSAAGTWGSGCFVLRREAK
jgi:hypothetical protein